MPGPKQNNIRKYPDANHQPCHKAADRKMRAEVRQEFSDKLSLEEKIARLPPEPHAKRQRARYLAALEKRNQPKPEPQKAQTAPATEGTEKKHTNNQKKYMKGAK